MENELTLASLFDGIGGFPLAGMRNGITPVWASEIEPFPIKVTAERFPWMTHLGDITQIDLPKGQKSGLKEAQEVLAQVRGIAFTRFTSHDVVRHPLVQRIVNAYESFNRKSDAG